MGDVAEGAGMDKRRRPLQGLHEVGTEGLAQEHGHGPRAVEILRGHRLALFGETHEDAAEAAAEILPIHSQGKDRHHFGRLGQHELAGPAGAFFDPSKPHLPSARSLTPTTLGQVIRAGSRFKTLPW